MKNLLLATACAAAVLGLSACAGLPIGAGGGAGGDWASAAIAIAKDPACSHTDVLDVMLGPVPSGHVHLERSGCKAVTPAKADPGAQPSAPALTVGQVVAPPAPPT
ncbi:MAG: hypothetical protein JF588_11565 [Caulobacterales bacterium]|nr:hypothetical protein [Caulobacterales bacterium]